MVYFALATPVPGPTVLQLLCPHDCGNFTFNDSSTVPVHWYPDFKYKQLNVDGSITKPKAKSVVCRDDVGAIVQSGDEFPVGTRKNLTCNTTDQSGNVQFNCSFGFVVIGRWNSKDNQYHLMAIKLRIFVYY